MESRAVIYQRLWQLDQCELRRLALLAEVAPCVGPAAPLPLPARVACAEATRAAADAHRRVLLVELAALTPLQPSAAPECGKLGMAGTG
ncbi:hypothetical protein OOT46_28485 [Aquabacterium sp. A7-Y]|uniref:hypothetical protein n=1 Tax=Aquabacterium sp. A7-Y TaxID=1349605 RepID=UPI00223D1A0B|nr:hypothetical protein [Aquabacterium sp. A7-Y]MCW7541740.1 hypothetical protein [Aquabacterium sp. A7-Y]